MPTIVLTTEIAAGIETVFDLSRSIDLHIESTAETHERAVAGRTSGLVELGESVTWEATHFFVRQQITVRIEQFDRPYHFRDSMASGAFSRFDHDHYFENMRKGTLMTDTFDFTSPFGIIGRVADWLIVTRHMRKLLETRNSLIRTVAESGDSDRFIRPTTDCQPSP